MSEQVLMLVQRETENQNKFEHVYTLLDLEEPSARSIRNLEQLIGELISSAFTHLPCLTASSENRGAYRHHWSACTLAFRASCKGNRAAPHSAEEHTLSRYCPLFDCFHTAVEHRFQRICLVVVKLTEVAAACQEVIEKSEVILPEDSVFLLCRGRP